MLTKKGKYGLKAMIDLARAPSGALRQSADIARDNHIPKKFLDAILAKLRISGLVLASKGPTGGYQLARPAADITTGMIVRALDGPLAPIRCASRGAFEACDDCADVSSCRVRWLMSRTRDAIANILDDTSLAALAATRRRSPGPKLEAAAARGAKI